MCASLIKFIVITLVIAGIWTAGKADVLVPPIDKKMAKILQSRLSRLQLHDSTRVTYLLELSYFHISKPDEFRSDLDSAYRLLKTAQTLSIRNRYLKEIVKSRILMSTLCHELGKDELAKHILKIAIKSARHFKLGRETAEAYFSLGVISNAQESVTLLDSSAKLYAEAGLQREQAYVLKELANVCFADGKGDKPRALKTALQAASIYKRIGSKNLHEIYHMLSFINGNMGNSTGRLSYELQALDNARKTGDKNLIGDYYRSIASTYLQIQDYRNTKAYIFKAMDAFQETMNYVGIYATAQSFMIYSIDTRNPDEGFKYYKTILEKYPSKNDEVETFKCAIMIDYFKAVKKASLAEPYFLKLLSISVRMGSPDYSLVSVYGTGMRLYFQLRDFDRTAHYLKLLKQSNAQLNFLGVNKAIHLYTFKLDSVNGDLISAIKHYQRYNFLNDSSTNVTRSMLLSSQQIQYEVKEKEQSIALLTRQAAVQKMNLQKKELQKNIIIAAAFLLFGVALLLYRLYANKKATTLQLEIQKQEIAENRDKLRSLLDEKEWLLKEIHHRVKNNLQVVISLLNSQSAYLESDALGAIKDSQSRIFSISLIHKKLYQTADVTSIDMSVYIRELVSHLQDCFDPEHTIAFRLELEKFNLDVSVAVPLGLILNEAITNCLKHAFPAPMRGTIKVILNANQGAFNLIISDNGKGMPKDVDLTDAGSLGLTLIQGLCKQIGAILDISQNSGTTIKITTSTIYSANTMEN